jgi:hypothetical protein
MAEPNQGTNHIYASGDRSVIDKNVGDRKGRHGEPLPSNPSYKGDGDDTSANKYYANLKGKGPNVNILAPTGGSRAVEPLVVGEDGDFGGVLDQAVTLAREGYRLVPVQIYDAQVERRFNAQLDMLLARERLTPEMRASIKVGRPAALANVADPSEGLTAEEIEDKIIPNEPTKEATAVTDGDLDDLDMESFVNGDLPEDTLESDPATLIADDDGDDGDDDGDDGDDAKLSELDEPAGS